MFTPVVDESIIKRAKEKGLLKINLHDLRDYSKDQHKKIDAPAYGGGGMVFKPEPVFSAVEHILGYKMYPKEKTDKTRKIILFTLSSIILYIGGQLFRQWFRSYFYKMLY